MLIEAERSIKRDVEDWILLFCRTWFSCMWTLTSAEERLSTMKRRGQLQWPQQDILKNRRKKHLTYLDVIQGTWNSSQFAMNPSMMLVSVSSKWTGRWEYVSLKSISLRSVSTIQKHLLNSNHLQHPCSVRERIISPPSSAKTTSTERYLKRAAHIDQKISSYNFFKLILISLSIHLFKELI